MRLRVKNLDLDAGNKYVVVLNEEEAREHRIYPLDRVRVKYGKKEITAIVDYATRSVKRGEIGLFSDCWEALGVKDGYVEVEAAEKPSSVKYIRDKLMGEELEPQEIMEIIKDVVAANLSDIEVAYFVAACLLRGMSVEETVSMVKAMVETGERLNLGKRPILDKHCIGGVPGNRTTMLLVPILASLGFYIPKTSSRAITSPSGTADTMEVLARVDFSVPEIREIVLRTRGAIVWGGGTGLAAADDKMIEVRHTLSLDPEGMLLASILAKKVAVGATHVIIDIPVGQTAKVQSIDRYLHLKRAFELVAGRLNLKLKVVQSDGSEPIGNGLGPVLEARDVLLALEGRGPRDLTEKSIWLASELLELAGFKGAERRVREAIKSGMALRKMREIIEAQEGDPDIRPEDLNPGKYSWDYVADRPGRVSFIHNRHISAIAFAAGAPQDKGAGIYLRKHVGDRVEKGEVIFTVYSNNKKRLKHAVEKIDPYTVVVR